MLQCRHRSPGCLSTSRSHPTSTTARALVDTDPRLRAVTLDGILVGAGWISLGTGAPSPVENAAQIAVCPAPNFNELTTKLSELSGTLEGARQAADDARVHAAATTAALRDHDGLSRTLDAEASRLDREVRYAETNQQKMMGRVATAEARVEETSTQLEDTLDRLARVDDDAQDDEPSTEARDTTAAALAQAKAMDVEARLALRTAEERAGQRRGRGDSLRRQAEYERQSRARHEQAMAKRRAQAELARTVELGARDVATRVEQATEQAARHRDEVNAQKTTLPRALRRPKTPCMRRRCS